jgi:uncharacterized protein (DUF1330 family)
MSAYVIVDIHVRDAERYEAYKQAVPKLIAKHGGEYLVRGGTSEVLEGAWQPGRLVVFRFPSASAIRDFFDDPEYAPLKALRREAAQCSIVAVDGIE